MCVRGPWVGWSGPRWREDIEDSTSHLPSPESGEVAPDQSWEALPVGHPPVAPCQAHHNRGEQVVLLRGWNMKSVMLYEWTKITTTKCLWYLFPLRSSRICCYTRNRKFAVPLALSNGEPASRLIEEQLMYESTCHHVSPTGQQSHITAAHRAKKKFIFFTQEKSQFLWLRPFAIRPQCLARLQP